MFRSPVVSTVSGAVTGARLRIASPAPSLTRPIAPGALADLAACRDNPAAARGWHHMAAVLGMVRILDLWGMTSRLLSDETERQDARWLDLACQASPPPDHPRESARRLIAAPAAPPARLTGCTA